MAENFPETTYHEQYPEYYGSPENTQPKLNPSHFELSPEQNMISEKQKALAYKEAQAKVKEMKKFYSHAFSYLTVNGFLFVLNMITSPGHWWFLYPALGWGMGLASHGFKAFGMNGLLGKDWEEKKIEEILQKQKAREKELQERF